MMIVRMHDKLACAILGTAPDNGPIVDEVASPLHVWEGNNLVTHFPRKPDNISHLLPYVPEWLKDMTVEGTTMFVDPIEFAELDYEVQEYFDIIKG